MKSFDPDYSEISNLHLAEIDLLCSQYESKRTQGVEVTIEAFLIESPLEVRSLLQRELIQIEMEILDAWDQLRSPKAMIERFPEQETLIRELWESLQQRTGPRLASFPNRDTRANAVPYGSTHDEGRTSQSAQESDDESQSLDDPSPRFRIVRNLAQGGIGTVFVAFDRELQREVAVKELKRKFANDRAVKQRFEVEATITGNLEHPNIVPIYATGRRSDGRPFYAMRLIRGRSMQIVISDLHSQHGLELDFRKHPAARDLLLRFVTVCRAVGFAHSRGFLHRDLKPSNIMVGDFGETLVVDWGLARNLRSNNQNQPQSSKREVNKQLESDKTLDGTIVGTPGYMSPEQAIGCNEEISIASDIYSLGATLFQIATNTIPYLHTGSPLQQVNRESVNASQSLADTDVSIESRKQHGNRYAFSQFGSFPPPLAAICRKAMQFDPSLRYSSAEMLAKDLEAWLIDEPVSVLPETSVQRVQRWAKAHPAFVAGGLATLLITLLAMGVTLSILSVKNESLRLSNLREQASALESSQNASVAKRNGEEAVRQRQRVLGILNTFLVDVERGLSNVPGGAAVQRNVLTTVLNKLGEISIDFADDQVNLSNAMALIDLGDLFSRFGTKDIKLDFARADHLTLSPLEAAGEMYAEAMAIAKRSTPQEGKDPRQMIAAIQQKQAEVLRQTARTPEALQLLAESMATRRVLYAESPKSVEAAMDVVLAVDFLGQIHLQDGDFSRARDAFVETESILTRLSIEFPNELETKRRLGVCLSRIADIAVHDGDLDLATKLYDQDLAIATELFIGRPNNATAKRDLCVSLDRIGNMAAQRGQLKNAMASYLESRRLREELHAAEPTDLKSSRELFVSYMKGGDTRMLLKEVADAQADYQKALALADDLARIDPQNATARRFQSMSAEVLADVAIAQMQLDDALQYAKKSLAISLELVAKDPTDGQMQRDLYICYVKVSKVYLERKDFEDCLNQLDLALRVVQPIYERQPESLQSMGDYSFVLLKRAEAYQRSGDSPSALKEFEIVIPLLETIVEANRQDAKSRRRLSNATTMLGRALLADNHSAEARKALERSRQLTTSMIEEGMRVEQMILDLAEIDEILASILDNY
jgi:eukaryotic-like serine/threonine-protein kinase